MKTIPQHIKHIKSQPHHVRKRVAFGAAATGTALIALVWLAGSLGTGAFALKATSFAENAGGVTPSDRSAENLAGAGAALPSVGPARIEIIDTASSTSSLKKAEQTTIPF